MTLVIFKTYLTGTTWTKRHMLSGARDLKGFCKSRRRLSDFTFSFHFHALEKEMATHSSVLSWRIPGTGEPGGLPSLGSHRVGHDWSDLAAAAAAWDGRGLGHRASSWIYAYPLGESEWCDAVESPDSCPARSLLSTKHQPSSSWVNYMSKVRSRHSSKQGWVELQSKRTKRAWVGTDQSLTQSGLFFSSPRDKMNSFTSWCSSSRRKFKQPLWCQNIPRPQNASIMQWTSWKELCVRLWILSETGTLPWRSLTDARSTN